MRDNQHRASGDGAALAVSGHDIRQVALDGKVIMTPPCIFCMENH